MTLKQTLEICELLESARVDGEAVRELLRDRGAGPDEVTVTRLEGSREERGSGPGSGHGGSGTGSGPEGSGPGNTPGTDFVRVVIGGRTGRRAGGTAPTLGVIGRLGGVGARPEVIGLVSDADGAVVALAAALKLLDLRRAGDRLAGDVIVATHICPSAPTEPHDPVPFMGAPVDMRLMNEHEVSREMDAILSIDTTKGNRVINSRGFAISPTVKEGWILRVSEDLLETMAVTTGEPPRTFPVTMQDITPYGNGVHHINSILQPSVATSAPVVGVAVTTVTAVPGCASGASHEVDLAEAVRFVVEVAKGFTAGRISFYSAEEFSRLVELYGPMTHLQTPGRGKGQDSSRPSRPDTPVGPSGDGR